MEYTGSLGRIFNLLLPKCQTKFSYKAGKLYNISILANAEIQLFHRTDVLISAWKPYIIWFYVRSIQPCIIISIRDFILVFFKLCWYEKDIFLLIFIIQNCQNVHWNHRKTSVFKIYLQLSFTSRWIMTFTDSLQIIRWGLINTDK